jgi:glycosyltransferase involved in cell wall biosynthesis
MIAWIVGPKSRYNTGIAKYSLELIDGLNDIYKNDVKKIYFEDNGKPNSLRRYIWQLISLPIFTLIKYNKYDLIIYQEAFAFLTFFRFFSRKKTMVIIHHVPEENDHSLKGKYLKIIFTGLRLNKKITYITPSDFTKESLSVKYGIEKENVFEIPNIIKAIDPKNKLTDSTLSLSDEMDFIAEIMEYKSKGYAVASNVGSFEARKNVDILPELISKTMKEVGPILLVKVGVAIDNVREENFKLECNKNNISCMLFGSASNEMITKVYQLTDVYLAPSNYEGFGRTVIEAQANSSIVIASDIEAHREITNGSAILIKDIKNIDEWKTELVKILHSSKSQSDKLKHAGMINSKRFSTENVINKLVQIL